MKNEHLVVDFNDDSLTFNKCHIEEYKYKTIFDNIEKYKNFMRDSVNDSCFEKVFNTVVFQIALSDPSTSYLENLYMLYNSIGQNELISGIEVPKIDKKSFCNQLRTRGYRIYKTKLTIDKNVSIHVKRVAKEETSPFV